MAQPTIIQGDMIVQGMLIPQQMAIPANSVDNASVQPGSPGNFVDASKTQHQKSQRYSQPNTAATTELRPLHIVHGATATLMSFKAGSIVVALGAATVTIDLLKNGVSVLNTPLVLNNANTARVKAEASLNVTSSIAGDWFDVSITAAAGGGTLPTGLMVEAVFNEDPF